MFRIEEKIICYDSVTFEPFNPEYAGISEEEIRQYMQEHPKVDDPNYTNEEIISDLTLSSGVYMIPRGTSSETIEYIENMINALVK